MAVGTTTALVMVGISTAMSVAGAVAQGQSQKKMHQFNAKMADRDAAIHKNNAIAARQQASIEVQKTRQIARRYNASTRANALKSGSTLEGSVSDILYDSSLQQEQDALTAVFKGESAAAAHQSGAKDSEINASLSRAQGKAAMQTGLWQGASNLVQGASSMAMISAQNPKPPKTGP